MMHVLATALFDRPAFKTCVSHGIVLGNDGQKMSKSLRNYPDVTEVFDRDGSDAMRWFLMASPILRGGNLIVTEQGIREGVRQVLLPIWNAYTFLALYAPKKGTWRTDSTHVLDRYILAKLARAARRPDRADGRLRHLRRMRRAAAVHRGADELVCATVPFAVLGRGPRRHRHPAHRAGGGGQAGRPAASADHRGDLARRHRRAVGAPRRLARAGRTAARRRSGRGHGPGARSGLGGVVTAQGEEAAGPVAVAETHCRRGEPATARALPGSARR